MDFVLVQQGKALGPYSTERVESGIASGEITKTARIWRPPWTEWVSIVELFPVQFGLTGNLFAEMDKKGEIRHKPKEDILERVHREIPSARVEDLLRQAKGKAPEEAQVRITSKNKEELVYQNLREAMSQGYVQKSSVESLIQELEETGGQRLFLYRLKPGIDAGRLTLTYEGVAEQLLGRRWRDIEFPVFHRLPSEPQISNFREYKAKENNEQHKLTFAPSFADGWILRIDASVRSEERFKETVDGKRVFTTHTYIPMLQDAVCVIRYWYKPQILEIRVPNFSARDLVTSLRDAVISAFGKQIQFETAFAAWQMPAVCTSLLSQILTDPRREPTLRRISGSLLRERDKSTMKIEIENQETADIRDTNARRDSVNAYLSEKSTVETMVAYFQPTKDDPETRVVIGAEDPNELSVRKIISARELDHVLFRLQAHS